MGKATFDPVPLAVAFFIERRNLFAGWVGLDHRNGIASVQEGPEVVTVIRGISQLVSWRGQFAQKRDREPDVTHLSGTENEGDQPTNGIRDGVDLGGPSTSAAPDRLVCRPPFPPALQRWALLVVLSIANASVSSRLLS